MNIFETFKPKNKNVAKYVQYYYLEINTENIRREFTFFPHFNNTISLYKSHSRTEDGSIIYHENSDSIQIFTPIRQEVITAKQLGEIYRIVVIFNPLGIQQFYKNLDFTNVIIDYEFFHKEEVEQIFDTQHIEILIDCLDAFLSKRFIRFENTVLENAISYIMENFENFSLEKLSVKLEKSRRHLNRLFNENLGVSIKKFQEIVLFRNAMEQKIFANPQKKFTSIAYDLNFSDQSHLNKIFSKFTQNSPKNFIKKGTLLGKEDTFWHIK